MMLKQGTAMSKEMEEVLANVILAGHTICNNPMESRYRDGI
jgi:hypothetical protein